MEKQSEILQSQNSTDGNLNKEQSSSELVKAERYKDGPLTIIGNDELGYFVSIGNYRLTERYKTIQECTNELERPANYSLWLTIVNALIDYALKIRETKSNENQ